MMTPLSETNPSRFNLMMERRSSDRFPIERDVRYKILDGRTVVTGIGRTIDMSSSGVLFTTEVPLMQGKRLELSVSWPAQLNNTCALKLVALGRVVRTAEDKAALAIEKYEFRTAGRSAIVTV
ncbi:MAG: PilZ domain-containing protein [Bryobacteraceae bacterium]